MIYTRLWMKQQIQKKNRARVNEIENRMTGLIEMLKINPTSNPKEIKNRNNMLEIVERILFLIN